MKENNKPICSTCSCGCHEKYCASKVFIFSTLGEEQFKEISKLIVTRRYKKGESIFFEDDLWDRLYIVNKGKIKVFKYTKEGKEQILYLLSEGDSIGELNLLKRGKFEFNGEALEYTSICTLSKGDFDNILINNPSITLKILEKVHDRVVNLENLVQMLSTKDIETRVGNLLLNLIENFGTKHDEDIIIDLPINREDMGNFAGITRETVSRTLSAMEEAGVINVVGNKKIIIKDIEYLKNLI
ncbi:Crp/Fnr family transcriptional regulator [uncultured Clostridium sp.]|uniref:Crp/Fnr family transcriptional regulator n=1 Tax=uncultured Clostridium sp. TaxID=59620 RepID=UPI0028E9501D|nr:Crp/Fnr family transcriptional regulator [uncultured Clostridium sp.]